MEVSVTGTLQTTLASGRRSQNSPTCSGTKWRGGVRHWCCPSTHGPSGPGCQGMRTCVLRAAPRQP